MSLHPRVAADLARCVEVVRAGDPALRSLVLTGAFARGEGAILDGRPQNDYDLVAVRGLGPPREPYVRMRHALERELGLHIDLATVSAYRLPFVARSIFWYETAARGRVLGGEDLLHRIPVKSPAAIERTEGLRLLVNRAAGLLLATGMHDPHAVRIQAAKALLAAVDAQVLAAGAFAPTHGERMAAVHRLRALGQATGPLSEDISWTEWAFQFKTQPAEAEPRSADMAWRAARRSLLDAVPIALRHAGLPSLDAYARKDGWVDRFVYHHRSASLPGARRWAMHPTGRVRVATLRLLEATPEGEVERSAVRRCLRGLVDCSGKPLATLEAVRGATLQ